MNLEKPSQENLEFILNELAEKLDVANRMIMEPEGYNLNKYDDLKFMYDVIMTKSRLSPSETQAFVDELRTVRKAQV